MKFRSVGAARCGILACAAVVAGVASADVKRCDVNFRLGTTSFDERALESCLASAKAGDSKIQFGLVQTAATPAGTWKYNLELSNARAQALKKHVTAAYPDIKLETFAVGELPRQGLRGVVIVGGERIERPVAATKPAAPANPPEVAVVEEEIDYGRSSTLAPIATNRKVDGRISARLGRDTLRTTDRIHNSVGVEFARINHGLFVPNDRLEYGASGDVMLRQGGRAGYTAHAFVGPGYKIGQLVGTLHAMAGVTVDDKNTTRFDPGAGVKAGWEGDRFSVLAGLGRTRELTRIGLDLGYML